MAKDILLANRLPRLPTREYRIGKNGIGIHTARKFRAHLHRAIVFSVPSVAGEKQFESDGTVRAVERIGCLGPDRLRYATRILFDATNFPTVEEESQRAIFVAKESGVGRRREGLV